MSCGKDYPPPPRGLEVVVVDLDGTLAESVWPHRGVLGRLIPEAREMLQHYAGLGYRIELHSARPAWERQMVVGWVQRHGLPVDNVVCGHKPLAGLYVDDRAFRPPWVPAPGSSVGEPGDSTEQDEILQEFARLLRLVTQDGAKKRAAKQKPSWKVDPSHEAAIFSHLMKWKKGELRDPDSGTHPLVHAAWRCLAVAWQELHERSDEEGDDV